MPTYQYQCTECETPLEVQQSFSDPSLTECPECQGRLRKVFNAVGVVFKGSGFYRNDSRGADPAEKAASGSSDASNGSDSKSDSSSDSSSRNDSSTKSDTGSSSSGSTSSGSDSGSSSSSSSSGSTSQKAASSA